MLECEFKKILYNFWYVQHAPLDLNLQTKDHTSFRLGIQTWWQLKIMQKFQDDNLINF
jgi:hypothetical protein